MTICTRTLALDLGPATAAPSQDKQSRTHGAALFVFPTRAQLKAMREGRAHA